MAGAFRCRLSFTSIFFFVVVQCGKLVRLFARVWNLLCQHHIQIGAVSSVCLVFVNVYLYSNGCRSWQLPALSHGFSPTFPKHYFHQPERTHLDGSSEALQSKADLNKYFENNILSTILDLKISPVVNIVWCDVGPFTFTHYLSVLSAFKMLKPSLINLHVVDHPYRDADGYYQFLDDLERDLPPLLVKQLVNKRACSGTNTEKLKAFISLIGSDGGVALNGRTVLIPSPLSDLLENKVSVGQDDSTKEPLVVFLQAGVFENPSQVENLVVSSKTFPCSDANKLTFSSPSVCAKLKADMFPRDIFNGSEPIHSLLRWVGYGSVTKCIPQPANEDIVPKIVHYVWLGERSLKYFAYLSVLSSLHVLKAEAVYIHGDYEPLGELWQEVKQDPRVQFINSKFPTAVYGQPIVKFASHASDYLRGDLLLRYGGVYADWDVIFLQEFPPHLRRYNTTANVDWPKTGAFPDVFNLGVLVAAPGAPFLRHFLESYRWYLDNHWSYNAIHIPYKVYEKIPASLNVDTHLQILCARHKCHATWLKDYKSTDADHLDDKQIDWTRDALAIHWTYPDPPAFESKEALIKDSSPVAKIGQHVLRRAGQIK